MASFSVIPEGIAGHGARLNAFASEIEARRSAVGAGASAAAGTPAAGALETSTANLHAVLGQFSERSIQLQQNLLAASQVYIDTDAAVQRSAE